MDLFSFLFAWCVASIACGIVTGMIIRFGTTGKR